MNIEQFLMVTNLFVGLVGWVIWWDHAVLCGNRLASIHVGTRRCVVSMCVVCASDQCK